MLTAPTANPRWRLKPCSACGSLDWMFGRKHLCLGCQSKSQGPTLPVRKNKPNFPFGAIEKMRKMRALGATWKIIAVAYDCEWPDARNYYLSHCGDAAKVNQSLRALYDEAKSFFSNGGAA